jgi:calcineurin-like phosphoesterase family protein
MINVGVDATGFRPISKGEISRVIQTGPDNRAPSTS